MSTPLLSEMLAMPAYDLLAIALRYEESPHAAAAALWDALVELGLHESQPAEVMMLLVGVPLDATPPHDRHTVQARDAWRRARAESITYVTSRDVARMYDGGARADWARAWLAYLLFRAWSLPMRARHGTRSPWAVVRAMVARAAPPRRRGRLTAPPHLPVSPS